MKAVIVIEWVDLTLPIANLDQFQFVQEFTGLPAVGHYIDIWPEQQELDHITVEVVSIRWESFDYEGMEVEPEVLFPVINCRTASQEDDDILLATRGLDRKTVNQVVSIR